MADLKISQLTAATLPLAGTEVLPIVQSGATVKVPVSDLTAGRAISATQITLTTGNVIVASGSGIDFSATPGTGTSELFNDYEEGTWTPQLTASGSGITNQVYATRSGTYTKVGRQVTVTAIIAMTSFTNASGNYTRISGLPFTPASNAASSLQYENFTGGTNGQIIISVTSTDAQIYFHKTDSNGQVGAVGVSSGSLQQTAAVVCTATYFV